MTRKAKKKKERDEKSRDRYVYKFISKKRSKEDIRDRYLGMVSRGEISVKEAIKQLNKKNVGTTPAFMDQLNKKVNIMRDKIISNIERKDREIINKNGEAFEEAINLFEKKKATLEDLEKIGRRFKLEDPKWWEYIRGHKDFKERVRIHKLFEERKRDRI